MHLRRLVRPNAIRPPHGGVGFLGTEPPEMPDNAEVNRGAALNMPEVRAAATRPPAIS